MRNYDWKRLLTTPGGRKWFVDLNTGRFSTADMSGKYPHLTDDGVLWIDTTKPIRVHAWTKHNSSYATATVLNEKGEAFFISLEHTELFWVAINLNMTIQVEGHGPVQVVPAKGPELWGSLEEKTDAEWCEHCGC